MKTAAIEPGQPAPLSSKGVLWGGRILSAVSVLFLLFDSVIHLAVIGPVVQAFVQLGYPASLARTLGIVELACVVLYAIPRTSVLGAMLLTGYLGGATAAKVRIEDPSFLFSVVVGVLVWGGLFLRDDRVRALIPLRG